MEVEAVNNNNFLKKDKKDPNKSLKSFKEKAIYGILILGICVFAGGTVYLMVNNLMNSARNYSSDNSEGQDSLNGYLVDNSMNDGTIGEGYLAEFPINEMDSIADNESAADIIGSGLPKDEEDTSVQTVNPVTSKDESSLNSDNPLTNKEDITGSGNTIVDNSKPAVADTEKSADSAKAINPNTATTETTKNNNKDQTNATFIMPVTGNIILDYSMDKLVYSKTLEEWRTHSGIDIASPRGTVVLAVSDGTITEIKKDPRYGITIVIEHDNGFKSIYANLATDDMVSPNQKVKAGDKVSCIGNTAIFESAEEAHLHFELYKDNKLVDPNKYLPVSGSR